MKTTDDGNIDVMVDEDTIDWGDFVREYEPIEPLFVDGMEVPF